MSRSHKIHRELVEFDKQKQKMVLTEMKYAHLRKEQEKLETDKGELIGKNEDATELDELKQRKIDPIIANYKKFVIVIDFFIAYVIVATLSEYIPYLPVWLKAFIAVAVYTSIEYAMNFLAKEPVAPKVPDTKKPFEYNEEYEQKMEYYQNSKMKYKKAQRVKHTFIMVIPAISLATMFQEFGVSYFKAGLEEGSEYASYYLNSDILYIIFKYVGLALLGYLSHYFLIEYGAQINAAKTRIQLHKDCVKLEKKIEDLAAKLSSIEESLVKMVMIYHQKLKMYVARFGKHNLLPSEFFSPMLDELYMRVNGYRVTD